ncbi:MAG TPA: hypothetical protein VF124_02730 [Gaiellaceae bacterium]
MDETDLQLRRWDGRPSPGWVPHTHRPNQAILERLGLSGEFWRLP